MAFEMKLTQWRARDLHSLVVLLSSGLKVTIKMLCRIGHFTENISKQMATETVAARVLCGFSSQN